MLNGADAAFLDGLRGQGIEVVAPEPRYLEEPRGRWPGRAAAVARPRDTAEVAAVLRAASAARVGIVPYGGGTGLVGGQVMGAGEGALILSLERMNAVRAIDPQSLVIEAGATLEAVHEAAASVGRRFPLTIGSQGTAQIGGCLSTNAGGVNVIRYGTARALCLGLEAVLADGTVWNGLTRLRKDNTGYDLRDLLIGAEGTLGIVTAAALRLFEPPAVEGSAFFTVPSPAAAVELLSLAQGRFAGCVSMFELISGQGLAFLRQTGPEVRFPFAEDPAWMVLIELGLPAGMDVEEAFAGLYEAAGDLVTDAVVAQSAAQMAEFWFLRETIPVANRRIGAISSHDISVPVAEIPRFIDEAGRMLHAMGDMRINCFGHVGDGNLHYNVFPAAGRRREAYDMAAVKHAVHDLVVSGFNGSVSAEHGIGRLKVGDLERYADRAKMAMMRALKAALDPEGILNPGAVLA
ncbi:FAD-binding oxidoreductase [Paenirhodobacter enshiensis]|uniref:2-hydroxyacid dehydrogenase n=1 Tax=Paenirhodobacter enshiensis TaxID=1105367 RepID=A0A086XZT9_9RHOB|nr:FAD-binding oxidoreductase [Paenirhodobacter enshiensis]KFI27539.1 2-hydroxyacid dehydrogenase [Paenirhodobacter enshiensis]